MPSISAPSTVLVTGANGLIAVQVVNQLLEHGFHVKGQVRSEAKGSNIKELFTGGNFELVVIEDFTQPGAFDEVLKGVDAIAHIAAPLPRLAGGPPEDMLRPAVDGTKFLLDSAKKAGTVKRVIVTSTIMAAIAVVDRPYNHTEDDWNDMAVDTFNKLGAESDEFTMYVTSKVLTERATFEYVNRNEVNFDVTTILPNFVIGPPLTETAKDFSSTGVLSTALANIDNVPPFLKDHNSFVDVRDTAELYIQCLLQESAGNQRFFSTSPEPFSWQKSVDILRAAGFRGVPEKSFDQTQPFTFDATKGQRLLGIKYTSLEDTIKDSFVEFIKRGQFEADGTPRSDKSI